MTSRVIVYVDGFNLYRGALQNGPDKWLDLERYFRILRRADDLRGIHYFTAIVRSPDSARNQTEYLRALATTEIVSIQLGSFRMKDVVCRVDGCCHGGSRRFAVPSEKRTDVQIALQLFEDAVEDRADIFVLVSGDSDLVPAVRRIRSRAPKKRVVVYVPARDPDRSAAVELRAAATKAMDLPLNLLKRAQFPLEFPDGHGGWIRKPADW
ncbi:MAG TPA: NYN domain-containing protein [Phycisphaerales bacterium]